MKLNKYIDHTLLSPEATEAQVEKVIKQAIDNHFHTVMINRLLSFKNFCCSCSGSKRKTNNSCCYYISFF